MKDDDKRSIDGCIMNSEDASVIHFNRFLYQAADWSCDQ